MRVRLFIHNGTAAAHVVDVCGCESNKAVHLLLGELDHFDLIHCPELDSKETEAIRNLMFLIPDVRGLMFKEPHISDILEKGKSIELRSRVQKFRGLVGIIGDRCALGVCTFDSCTDYVSLEEALEDADKTFVSDLHKLEELSGIGKKLYGIGMSHIYRFHKPIRAGLIQGQQTWVTLSEDVKDQT